MAIPIIQSVNLDAGESAFFARQLEYIKEQTYDVKYAELKARMVFPVSNAAGTGATAITWREYDQTGEAQLIANYAKDLPRADVFGRENVGKVYSLGNSYGWNVQEIRSAQMFGLSLEQRKANAARRAHEQAVNRIAFFGDTAHNLPGLMTVGNGIPRVTAPADGAGGLTTFASKTATQIIRDLNALANGIFSVTEGTEIPDTLLLPIEQFTLISTTQLSSGTDMTILKYFLANQPFIRSVEWVNELNGAGTAGVDVALAYRRNPDALTLEIPVEFEQFPVQEQGLEMVIPCHSRIGGLLLYYPLSLRILEGI